jgi:kelch-like protein 1/4/5
MGDDCSPVEAAECHRSPNHADRMLRRMEAFHAKGQLSDVTLVCGTRRIPAHRIVLSSASDYFAAMFTNDVREATQDEVRLKDVDGEALGILVHYMYTGWYNASIFFPYPPTCAC